MRETKHTPTPWKFIPWHIEEGPSAVRAPEGWLICETSSDANAEMIVLAVNSHASLTAERDRLREENERLTKALAKLVKWYGLRGDDDELLPEHKQEAEIATAMALLDRGAS